jgi:hypothetical protein
MIGILRSTELTPAFEGSPLTDGLAEQLRKLGADIAPELPLATLNRAIVAWAQLFGLISFELFGQLVGSVDPSDEFFDHAIGHLCDFVGLPVTS